MIPTRGWVQDMVMRIQDAFLDAPTLTLTAAETARRFGLEPAAAQAFLDALADAGVLLRGRDGAYGRPIAASHLPAVASFEPRSGNRAA